jgi:Skp1 family, tetramerisation domain
MADDMDNVMLRLKSMADENGNCREFDISYGAAKLSELIKDSVGEDFEEDDVVPEIDVPRVKGDCLAKVVDFMKHYKEEPMKEIPTPLGGSSFNEVRREWRWTSLLVTIVPIFRRHAF